MQYTRGRPGSRRCAAHRRHVKNAFYIGECMELGPQGVHAGAFLPLLRVRAGTLNTVTHEGTMVPVEQFDPEQVLQAVHEERCTAVLQCPPCSSRSSAPDFEQYDTPAADRHRTAPRAPWRS